MSGLQSNRTIGKCILLVCLTALLLILTACSKPAATPTTAPKPTSTQAAAPKPAELPKALTFTSGPQGGNTFVVVNGLASVIQKFTGIKVITQPMPTYPLEFTELAAGRSDILLPAQTNSYLVFRGQQEYKEAGPRPLRSLGSGSASGLFWVTRPDTGIKSIKDMAGKKLAYVSETAPATTDIFQLTLDFYGIGDKVTKLAREGMGAAAKTLIEKRVDAMAGPYGSFALEIEQATGIVSIPLDAEVTAYIAKNRPDLAVVMATFPVGWYGLKTPVSTGARALEMVVHPRMADNTAYIVTQSIYDHPKETAAIHFSVGEFNLDNAMKFNPVIPMHPGSIKYFKEKGIWTKEHDAFQQKLLAEEKDLMAKK